MFEFIAFPFVFLLALLVIGGMALLVHWGARREQGLLPYVFYPILLVYGLSNLLSGRDLSLTSGELAVQVVAKHALVVWLGRLTSLFILLVCAERILHRLLTWGRKAPLAGGLLLAFWVFFLSNTISPALFGRHFYLSHEFLYVIVLGWAALLITEEGELRTALGAARNASLLLLFGSLLCLLIKPKLVMVSNYAGLMPGLHWRFVGLAGHSNTFGLLLVFFMLCLWCQPFQWRLLQLASWGAATLALVLAQSKTAWVAWILCALSLAYFGRREQLQRLLRDFRRPYLSLALLSGLLFGVAVLSLGFMFGDFESRVTRFFNTQQGVDLLSVSGRRQIWQIAVQEWERNPVFGYGLSIWDETFRRGIGMPFASHAHSQFYQSLSSAGLVGVAGLLGYTGALLYFVTRTAHASGGLSLALFILLACRALSEVPLAMKGLSPDLLTQLLLLIVLSVYYRPPSKGAAPAPCYGGRTAGVH